MPLLVAASGNIGDAQQSGVNARLFVIWAGPNCRAHRFAGALYEVFTQVGFIDRTQNGHSDAMCIDSSAPASEAALITSSQEKGFPRNRF